MSEWTEHTIQVHDLTLHYTRTGTGEKTPMVLLHGVMDNGFCWTPVARELQRDFDVIMPDARGHGLTGGPLESFSYPQLASDAAALIDALGLDRPYLFGHSMGAITAMMVAADHPELVRALIMEDPVLLDAPPTPPAEQEEDSSGVEGLLRILNIKHLPPEERLQAARSMNPRWSDDELGPWIDSKIQFNPEVFLYLKALTPWRTMLPRITCPILLLTGDPQEHAIVTPEIAQVAANLWQHGEVVHIPQAGHCIHRDRFTESMAAVQAFLTRVA